MHSTAPGDPSADPLRLAHLARDRERLVADTAAAEAAALDVGDLGEQADELREQVERDRLTAVALRAFLGARPGPGGL